MTRAPRLHRSESVQNVQRASLGEKDLSAKPSGPDPLESRSLKESFLGPCLSRMRLPFLVCRRTPTPLSLDVKTLTKW